MCNRSQSTAHCLDCCAGYDTVILKGSWTHFHNPYICYMYLCIYTCFHHYKFNMLKEANSTLTNSTFGFLKYVSNKCWSLFWSITWWGYQLTKTSKMEVHRQYLKSCILNSVCCVETYIIHSYHMSKCSKCNWNRYINRFCMWKVNFHINGLSPNIAYVILMSWPLMAIYFLLLNYWLFYVQFSYHILW